MIRMIHFADVHIGVENYGKFDPGSGLSSRVKDFLTRLENIIDYAGANKADLAIFAGDAFKNYQPNPTLQREFAHRVRALAEICPVVLLVGNHDQPPSAVRAYSTEIYDTLGVPNVIVGGTYHLHQIATRSGMVQVATAPYPTRALLIDPEEARTKTTAELDQLVQAKLGTLLRDLALEAAVNAPGAPRVLTGHFTVTGAQTGIESTLMLGRDLEVPLSTIADPTWDYVALGHIHKHQNMTQQHHGVPPVVYSGSPEAIDFGEEGETKGFCWVELERGHTHWQFHKLGNRPFITLSIDVLGSSDPTADAIAEIDRLGDRLAGAIVRLFIQLDDQVLLDERALLARLAEWKVSYAVLSKQIVRARRSRLSISPEQLSDTELLDAHLSDKGLAEVDRRRLLEKAQMIFEAVNPSIV